MCHSLSPVPDPDLPKPVSFPDDNKVKEMLGASFVPVFILFPGTELLNPWHILGDRSIFCFNEMTLGRFLDEAWPKERPSHDLKLGTFNPTPHPLGKGGSQKLR